MAEAVSQEKDPSGGIGITDLQVDYGRSSILGSRKFVLRMTINDPAILDERFEYSKLATFTSQFLIIYGWSNPETVPGYDAAMSPPKLEVDPREPSKERLVVPIRNLGNGGYWSAGRVNISKYDFGFNEMGKLEITITLLDASTLGLSSTIISSVGRKFKQFLTTGALDQMITSADGSEFTLKEALHARQLELNKMYNDPKKELSYDEYTFLWGQAIKSLEGRVTLGGEAFMPEEEGDELSYITEEDVRNIQEEARKPQKGYPFQNALYTYKQIYATVVDNSPPEDGQTDSSEVDQVNADEDGVATSSSPTKQVISYEKKAAYYFLGAIMDSVSLCMASAEHGIGASRVPSFYYRNISKDSKLSTAFQNKLKSVNRATGMEEKIQEAVIRLKERFLPPSPIEHFMPDDEAWTKYAAAYKRATGEELSFFDRWGVVAFGGAPEDKTKTIVSGTRPVYEGIQTSAKTRVINALFPGPPAVSQMVGAPMRGHIMTVDTGSSDNAETLLEKKLESVGVLRVYLPDWKQEISVDPEGNERISSGSPDGFDPLNPSDYRAAMPRKSPNSPTSPNFEERSQAPYGRGGKFWMIVEMEIPASTFSSVAGGIAGGTAAQLGSNKVRMILDYDTWRLTNKETWNLLQKKWHNLYREYLAAYFESVIRKRINDIEPFGIPIEAIFNEPLDLDWMTGMVYRNAALARTRDFLFSWEDIEGKSLGDFDLDRGK